MAYMVLFLSIIINVSPRGRLPPRGVYKKWILPIKLHSYHFKQFLAWVTCCRRAGFRSNLEKLIPGIEPGFGY